MSSPNSENHKLQKNHKTELATLQDDTELFGKFVQLVGHLYIHESGIVCLSSHILETAYQPNENFEPCLK